MLFGIGRAVGTLANITWDRALGYPIERPKSLTTTMLEEAAAKATTGAAGALLGARAGCFLGRGSVHDSGDGRDS